MTGAATDGKHSVEQAIAAEAALEETPLDSPLLKSGSVALEQL